MVMVIGLALGVIEIALTLYARNVVEASAHQGARAAIELGADPATAQDVAYRTVRRAAGGLVQDLNVRVGTRRLAGRDVVRVMVTGRLRPPGPIPALVAVSATSTLTKQERVP